jgi:hypothetical protein
MLGTAFASNKRAINAAANAPFNAPVNALKAFRL